MSKLEKFRELGISEKILKALEKKGFEEPTPIQAATIPLLLTGDKDVVGQAQTGTGKTAAFGIPIIERINDSRTYVQAAILAPTRELAIQIAEEMNSLKGESSLKILPIYGGQTIEIQIRMLKKGADIVVGTPGRMLDLIKRGCLKLDDISYAVLDEADEMMAMGFVEDIESILSQTSFDKKTLMFSATMPKTVMSIAEKFMNEYEVIKVESEQLTTSLTEQIYFEVRREHKFEALSRIIDMEADFYALVFCRTRNDVDELVEKLQNRGYPADGLHGDISQGQRIKTIERFKRRNFNILIATDVAARGIDINNLTHVINYSIPQEPEAYIHRIGRTGRAGNQGSAITFVTPAEYRKLTHIKKVAKTDIAKKQLPDASQIVASKKGKLKECLESLIDKNKHSDYLEFAQDILKDSSPVDALSALLRFTMKDELMPERYAEIGPGGRRGKQAVDVEGKTRLFVALGKDDGYNPRRIVDMIWDNARVKGRKIDNVKCFDKFTFITVPFSEAERIIDAFHNKGRGRRPLIEIAQENKEQKSGGKKDSKPVSDENRVAKKKKRPEHRDERNAPDKKKEREDKREKPVNKFMDKKLKSSKKKKRKKDKK
jgi:ATP-dependent RNA helicase DeaD